VCVCLILYVMLAMCPRPDMVPSDAEDDDPAPLVGPTREEKRDELLAAGGTVCSKSKCARVVAFDDSHKTCEMCRTRAKRNNTSDKGKAAQARYKQGKAEKRAEQSEEGQARDELEPPNKKPREEKRAEPAAVLADPEQPIRKTREEKRTERAAMLDAGGTVCSNSFCVRVVAFGDAHKTCAGCLANGKKTREEMRDKKRAAVLAAADPEQPIKKTREEMRAERAAMLDAGGTVCSNGNCQSVVAFGDTHKGCERCRASGKRNNTSDKGQASRKRYNESEKCQASQKLYNQSDKGKASQKLYNESDKGRAKQKRQNDKLSSKLGASLRMILMGKHDFAEPMTFMTYGVDRTEAEWQAHFASQFEPWMDWPNHGRHRKGAPYKSVWNIGHKIAKSCYDHSDPDEVRKCWSLANLFPQCAKENVEQGKRYLPSLETLLAMRAEWPKAWNGVLPDCVVALLDPDASDDSDDPEDSDNSDDESDESDCADCAD